MAYKSEDEAHAALELASMRNGRRFSFEASPAANSLSVASTTSQPIALPTTSDSPSSSTGKKKTKSSSDSKPASAAASSKAKQDDDSADAKGRKRRRVVVACDTCRRKKVKCEGLPNPNNTCNNCTAYNYRCTFTSDSDRSRGKYEILESKVETLLSALRSVAPHIAQQYEKGELNIAGPSGSSAPPNNANAWRSLVGDTPKSGADAEQDELDSDARNNADDPLDSHRADWPSRSRPPLSGPGADEDFGADDTNQRDHANGAAIKREDRDALLPDVEEGRPRYFGRSSAMTLFHSIADESRPPSPGPLARSDAPTDHAGISYETYRPQSTRGKKQAYPAGLPKSAGPSSAARPLYPTNSKEWILLLRRKNTVAVGRDDAVTEEWFERYSLPESDLIKDLFDLFFERLHPLMPILHRPSIERDLASGRADKDSAFRGFIFTILAIASRFSKDPRVLADPNDPETAGDHFAAGSRLYHQVYAASLINVQVMILTATFMHGSIGPGASWTVLGVAIRALQDIGLHQEKAYRDFSPYEQELRRRVFWGAFILDCIFSVNMGRPLALKLSDCDVKLPLEIDDDELFKYEGGGPISVRTPVKPIVMSGFIHMIKLNVLVQDVVHILYSPRWRQETGSRKLPPGNKQRGMPEYKDMAILSKRMDEWVAETPTHLQTLDSPFKLQAGIVQCATHDIRLYILKPFLEHAALRKMLHRQCVIHARECLKVVIELYEGAHVTDLVFIFQQAFMSTATFMITVWHECREVDRLAEDNDLVEATLRTFASFDDRFFSKLFRRAHRILRDIALRTMHTMTSDQRERVSRLLQRGDLRMPGLVPSTLLGMKPAPVLMQHQRPDASLPPSVRSTRRVSVQSSEATMTGSGATGGGMGAGDPISAASYIHTWSPIPSAPMSPNRIAANDSSSTFANDSNSTLTFNQYMMGHGGAGMIRMGEDGSPSTQTASADLESNDGARMTSAHPASFGDARGILPFFAPTPDDPGSTQHQLEDLSWTDYFSKFLDDIGSTGGAPAHAVTTMSTGSASLNAPMEMQFAVGSPSSFPLSNTPRRTG